MNVFDNLGHAAEAPGPLGLVIGGALVGLAVAGYTIFHAHAQGVRLRRVAARYAELQTAARRREWSGRATTGAATRHTA
jgi:hypothetical protein